MKNIECKITASEVDKAYAAGIVDGEGCIRVHWDKRCNSFNPTVMVEMSEYETIKWLSDTFGSRKIQVIKNQKRKSHWRQTYRWELRCAAALLFLEQILPYLRGKKNQAEALIEWPGRDFIVGRGRCLPVSIKEERYAIFRKLQELKRETANSFNEENTNVG